MSYEIRSDLQIKRKTHKNRLEYPFVDLKVGQCIVVPATQRATLANRAREFLKANPGWELEGGAIEHDRHGFWCRARPDVASAEKPQPPETPRAAPALPPIKHRSAALDQRARAGK